MSELPGGFEHLQRALETAFPAAKGVVRFGVGAVEADAQPMNARLPGALERLARGQRSGRRRQGQLQPAADGMADQLEQVGPLQRIAAGQHDHRRPRESRHLIQQGLRLIGRKLPGCGILLRRRPAVLADQVAGHRDLVIEHQRVEVEIGRRVVGVRHPSVDSWGDAGSISEFSPAGALWARGGHGGRRQKSEMLNVQCSDLRFQI